MPKYLLVVKGAGEGCDYTLGCNRNAYKLSAKTPEEAIDEILEDYYEGPDAYHAWEKATLVEVVQTLPLAKWDKRKRKATAEAERKEAAEKAELARLQAKYGG